VPSSKLPTTKTLIEWAIPLIAEKPIILIRTDVTAQLARPTDVLSRKAQNG
jgi:hypothetical protein